MKIILIVLSMMILFSPVMNNEYSKRKAMNVPVKNLSYFGSLIQIKASF